MLHGRRLTGGHGPSSSPYKTTTFSLPITTKEEMSGGLCCFFPPKVKGNAPWSASEILEALEKISSSYETATNNNRSASKENKLIALNNMISSTKVRVGEGDSANIILSYLKMGLNGDFAPGRARSAVEKLISNVKYCTGKEAFSHVLKM